MYIDITGDMNDTSRENGTTDDSSTSGFCATDYCIPMVVVLSIIALFGMFGNFLVVGIILNDKKIHRVTFVSLAVLAISDLLFLVPRYVRYIVQAYFSDDFEKHDYDIFRFVLDFVSLIGAGSSIVNIVLLSVMRYFMVVHPLRTHVWLTIHKVFVISGIVWGLCALNAGFYMFAVVIQRNDQDLSYYTNIVITILMSVLPVVLIVIFHLLKARKLHNSLMHCNEDTVKRMSRVITFVCACFLITTMPSNIMDVMRIASFHSKEAWFKYLSQIGRVLLFLNYSINPYIYFLHAPQMEAFISKLKRRRGKPKYSLSQSATRSSAISDSTENLRLTTICQNRQETEEQLIEKVM